MVRDVEEEAQPSTSRGVSTHHNHSRRGEGKWLDEIEDEVTNGLEYLDKVASEVLQAKLYLNGVAKRIRERRKSCINNSDNGFEEDSSIYRQENEAEGQEVRIPTAPIVNGEDQQQIEEDVCFSRQENIGLEGEGQEVSRVLIPPAPIVNGEDQQQIVEDCVANLDVNADDVTVGGGGVIEVVEVKNEFVGENMEQDQEQELDEEFHNEEKDEEVTTKNVPSPNRVLTRSMLRRGRPAPTYHRFATEEDEDEEEETGVKKRKRRKNSSRSNASALTTSDSVGNSSGHQEKDSVENVVVGEVTECGDLILPPLPAVSFVEPVNAAPSPLAEDVSQENEVEVCENEVYDDEVEVVRAMGDSDSELIPLTAQANGLECSFSTSPVSGRMGLRNRSVSYNESILDCTTGYFTGEGGSAVTNSGTRRKKIRITGRYGTGGSSSLSPEDNIAAGAPLPSLVAGPSQATMMNGNEKSSLGTYDIQFVRQSAFLVLIKRK